MAKTIISTGEKPHLPETTNRKDLLLRRIGGAVTGLVSRFKNLYPGIGDSSVNFDAAGGDTGILPILRLARKYLMRKR